MSPVIALHAPRVALPEGTPPALRQGLRAAGCTVLAQGTHPDGAAEWTFDWVLCSAAEWAELQVLKCQLEERRWTDRAKGLLMQSQQIDETQSYKLLRDAAMQAQRKLPALARQLVHQHEQAEALERAGAQRMLSQRLVRLQAQALLDLDGRLARAWQAESVARVQGNLARLQELLHGPVREQELAAVQAAWKQLEGVLTAPPCREGLAALDAAAQSLLDASEALVDTLCQQAGERPPHLLVLCTRQRLLSQRLVKEALLPSFSSLTRCLCWRSSTPPTTRSAWRLGWTSSCAPCKPCAMRRCTARACRQPLPRWIWNGTACCAAYVRARGRSRCKTCASAASGCCRPWTP